MESDGVIEADAQRGISLSLWERLGEGIERQNTLDFCNDIVQVPKDIVIDKPNHPPAVQPQRVFPF